MHDRLRRHDKQDILGQSSLQIKGKCKIKNSQSTEIILGCCFDVMNELGSGFPETVYKNALYIAILEKGLKVEKRFEVVFRGRKIGLYISDLIVEGNVVVELKCVGSDLFLVRIRHN